MFRALYVHHQELELYWCSIWYRHSKSVAVRSTGWEILDILYKQTALRAAESKILFQITLHNFFSVPQQPNSDLSRIF